MVYHFEIHKEEDGYFAECIELKGCMTQGDTLDELKEMAEDALNCYLLEPIDSKFTPHPLPDPDLENSRYSHELLLVECSSQVALVTALRDYRFTHKLTQHQMREALGMKHRNSYVRLEREGNPSMNMLDRIRKAFPDFPLFLGFQAPKKRVKHKVLH